MKFCINCVHSEPTENTYNCKAIEPTYNLVTGAIILTPCSVARTDKGNCGTEGKLFEEKKSFLTSFLNRRQTSK